MEADSALVGPGPTTEPTRPSVKRWLSSGSPLSVFDRTLRRSPLGLLTSISGTLRLVSPRLAITSGFRPTVSSAQALSRKDQLAELRISPSSLQERLHQVGGRLLTRFIAAQVQMR